MHTRTHSLSHTHRDVQYTVNTAKGVLYITNKYKYYQLTILPTVQHHITTLGLVRVVSAPLLVGVATSTDHQVNSLFVQV